METALYHQHGLPAKKLDILKKHANGTVDLGEGGTLVVGGCPLSPSGAPGTATINEDTASKAKAEAEAKAKAEAEAKAKAEAEAKAKAEAEAKRNK